MGEKADKFQYNASFVPLVPFSTQVYWVIARGRNNMCERWFSQCCYLDSPSCAQSLNQLTLHHQLTLTLYSGLWSLHYFWYGFVRNLWWTRAYLLEDGHPLSVDLELLAVEAHLGLPALLDVALELVDDLVLLLVPLVLRPHSVHVRAVLGLLHLLLQGERERLRSKCFWTADYTYNSSCDSTILG